MPELVAYEDSPLAQYLQEAGLSELLVADENPYTYDQNTKEEKRKRLIEGRDTASTHLLSTMFANLRNSGYNIKKLISGIFGPSENRVVSDIALEILESTVNILADSGHMTDRYTPKPIRRRKVANDKISVHNSALTISWISLLAAGGITLAVSPRNGIYTFKHPADTTNLLVKALLAAATTLPAIRYVWRHHRMNKITYVANKLLSSMKIIAYRYRILDISVQNAIKFIQEVAFVSRGFRVPHYAGTQGILLRPGRGMLWAASHLRQTVITALTSGIQALFSVLVEEMLPIASQIDQHVGVDISAAVIEFQDLFEALIRNEEECSLDQLRQLFELHFALRKLWFQGIIGLTEFACKADMAISQKGFYSRLNSLTTEIERVLSIITESVDDIKKARDAEYTAKRWAALSKKADGSGSGSAYHPVVRSLNSMTSTIDTISAKLYICKEAIGYSEDENDEKSAIPYEELARVFTSLKSDIDILNGLYQQIITNLTIGDGINLVSATYADQRDGKLDNSKYNIDSCELDSSDIPEGAQVFGYTPLEMEDTDDAEMVFEADLSEEQEPKSKRHPLGRSERIRIQKQQREEDEKAKQRKGEINSIMLELRSAISNRTKAGGKQTSEREEAD
ncbi:hypothetical protein GGI25_001403 [Coemansia spiralis]|uniref:Myosin-binding domain-containing protein n=2 Tax=Coemansia TaxID=4863 RepID=A0A9W8GAH7_9FUNG|nr:hypothetical protein EDC05_001368 [Coemansia umbellata]KAJ2679480.1 hypothetical protein GGI25_001403 [Coemansia spiralis]